MNTPAKFWMMIPWGRVGSNLLLNNIKQIVGDYRCELVNENFSRIRSPEAQIDWMNEFYDAETDLDLIGCKQNLRRVASPDQVGSLLANRGIRLIRLRRDNYLKVAISQLRGEIYAERSRAETGVRLWGVHVGRAPLGPQPLDAKRFLRVVALAKDTDHRLACFTPDTPTLDIEYEQLLAGSDRVAAATCEWLGLSARRPATPKFIKATPDNLEEAVPNLPELRDALSRSTLRDLAHMFDD
ncbi:MAG: hypothetical protein H0X27_01485 [Caulobacteraceae bacterium]|nr:hypothetical protein [Caulobacteraceae bacterium]